MFDLQFLPSALKNGLQETLGSFVLFLHCLRGLENSATYLAQPKFTLPEQGQENENGRKTREISHDR